MRYQFKYTFNPEQASLDKSRKSCIVECETGVLPAMAMAFETMGISDLYIQAIDEYLENIASHDTSEGWEWSMMLSDATATFEWRPLEDITTNGERSCGR